MSSSKELYNTSCLYPIKSAYKRSMNYNLFIIAQSIVSHQHLHVRLHHVTRNTNPDIILLKEPG
jgi:hypothetical protein